MNDTSTQAAWETFVHNITWLRTHYGISMKAMAKIMGISVQTLRKVEQGEKSKRINAEVLIKLCDYFQCHADELIRRKMWEKESPISTKSYG